MLLGRGLPWLPFGLAAGAEPVPALVFYHVVRNPRVVASLVPAVIAPVAKDHLVAGRAVHTATLLA